MPRKFLLLILVVLIWPLSALADDFPLNLIEKQVEVAKVPVLIDLSTLKPGDVQTTTYAGMPVLIYARTDADMNYLAKPDETRLADPHSDNMELSLQAVYTSSSSVVRARLLRVGQPAVEKADYRSLDKRILVIGGWGPHSGCEIVRPQTSGSGRGQSAMFVDPCAGLVYDAAGRVFKDTLRGHQQDTSPRFNLYIPPYTIVGRTALVIGLPKSIELPDLPPLSDEFYAGLDPTHRLMMAARYNDLSHITVAISDGADVNYYKPGEGSPIDEAITGSSEEIIQYLLDEGAKPTAKSYALAKYMGRPDLIHLLQKPF